jgi:hypothetical protein
MDDKEMFRLLRELMKSEYWPAIKKFNQLKDAQLVAALVTVDPFKDPTSLARTQGMRNGIYSLENLEMQQSESERKDSKVPTYNS